MFCEFPRVDGPSIHRSKLPLHKKRLTRATPASRRLVSSLRSWIEIPCSHALAAHVGARVLFLCLWFRNRPCAASFCYFARDRILPVRSVDRYSSTCNFWMLMRAVFLIRARFVSPCSVSPSVLLLFARPDCCRSGTTRRTACGRRRRRRPPWGEAPEGVCVAACAWERARAPVCCIFL